MALPTAFARERVTPITGVILVSIKPGDPTFEVELQRALDAGGGSPGTFASIITLPPMPSAGIVFADKLPLDGVLRYYRARHVRQGWNDGAFSVASAGVAPASERTVPQRAGGDTGVEMPYQPVSLQVLTGGEFDHGVVSVDTTIDWNKGRHQAVQIAAPVTFTFVNPSLGSRYILRVEQHSSGPHAATWPTNVRWTADTVPTESAATRTDLYAFEYSGAFLDLYFGSVIPDLTG